MSGQFMPPEVFRAQTVRFQSGSRPPQETVQVTEFAELRLIRAQTFASEREALAHAA
jgi:hypothetical protein